MLISAESLLLPLSEKTDVARVRAASLKHGVDSTNVLFPHILLNISFIVFLHNLLNFINTCQPSTFLPFCSALSHPFGFTTRLFLSDCSLGLDPLFGFFDTFPTVSWQYLQRRTWLWARNSWHRAQELSAIVSVQTAEFINNNINWAATNLITVSVSFAYN